MSKESLHMQAEAVGLNHLADKVELAGQLEKPELTDQEIVKIAQDIYEKWDAAGLNGDDLKAVITPEGTIDYKKIEALIEQKQLSIKPLELTAIASEANAMQKQLGVMHLKSIAADLEAGKDIEIGATKEQLRAHGMSEEQVESMLRAKNLALTGDGRFNMKVKNNLPPHLQKLVDEKKLDRPPSPFDELYKGRAVIDDLKGEKVRMQTQLHHDFAAKQGVQLHRFSGLEILVDLFKILTNPADRQAQAEALELLKIEPNIFIFSKEAMTAAFAMPDADITLPEILDLPFRTCLIEGYISEGGKALVPNAALGGKWGQMEAKPVEEAEIMIGLPILYIHEQSFKHYELLGAMRMAGTEQSGRDTLHFPFSCSIIDGFVTNLRVIDKMTKEDPILTTVLFNAVKKIVWRLANLEGHKSATVKTNIRVKMKSKGETYFHKIKHVIYLGLTHEKGRSVSVEGEPVDWSHRWEVRGHWRKIRGVGKDRDNKPIVNGFTWVVPHIKGDESLPLIKKIRADLPPKELT